MTDTEIIEAIATKVMGWTRVESFGGDVWHPTPTLCTLWNPLYFAQDAKVVREKLAKRFTFTGLLRRADYAEVDSKEFRFYVQDRLKPEHHAMKQPERFEVFADTEERAVCLCALKSVGIEP